MRFIVEVVQRLRSVLSPSREDRELDEELRFHIDKETEKNLTAGLRPREARRQAHIKFGGVERMRERTREARGVGWIEVFMRDVRYGARGLRRNSGFTLSVMLVLALGIGATAAVFSVFDAVLLAPLPYPEPDRIVQIWAVNPRGANRSPVSGANAAEWPEVAESFAAMGVYRTGRTAVLTGSGEPSLWVVADVQSAVFDVHGIRPMLGRRLVEADDTGDGRTVVMSHDMWERILGSDTAAVGSSIELDGLTYEVVGVMPPPFSFPDANVDMWVPLVTGTIGMEPDDRGTHSVMAIGRLHGGVSLQAAQTEMSAMAARGARDHPELAGWGVNLVGLQDDMTADVRPLLTLLLVGVGVVLLVACGNLANLLLARAIGRDREIAVRMALGAGRRRIIGQLLTEGFLLTCLGGAAGLLLAPTLLRGFIAIAPTTIPLVERAGLDARMLLFALGLTLSCAAAISLAPAFRQTNTIAGRALRGSRNVGAHGRLRAALLVFQVSLAVVLLVGAGLFLRTFSALARVDLGFDRQGLTTLSVVLPLGRYPTLDGQTRFFDELLGRTSRLPGVISVGGSSGAPGTTGRSTFPFVIEGREARNPNGREDAEDYRMVTPGYFATLRQPLLHGREFTADDLAGSPSVAVVNETFARKLWPGENPLGQRIATPVAQREGRWLTVVGVVADARLEGPDVEPVARFYGPYAQHDQVWQTWMTLVARVGGGVDPFVVQDGMRAALLDLDSGLPPRGVGSVEQLYEFGTRPRAFAMTVAVAFALAALFLSVVGLHGLVSYAVAARTKEIGLRMALGADPAGVVRVVVLRAMALAGIGALLGVVIALAATQMIESMLFGVTPTDVWTYVGTLALVLVVVAAAAALPARRAARISPVGALAAE